MPKYRCVKRLSTDNLEIIHEVDEIVELTGEHEQAALRAEAVVLIKETKKRESEGDA